jgi:hypothetical protein
VSVSRVCQYLQEQGEPARRRGPAKGADPKLLATVAQLWPRRLAGELSTSDVARAVNRSELTVTRWARALGFDVPQGRQRKHPKIARVCGCGCGTTFEPFGAHVTDGYGYYVNPNHWRRALEAAEAEFARQDEWLTVKQAAARVKVENMTLRKYRERGRIAFADIGDVPELAHLSVLRFRFRQVVRREDAERLRGELLGAWKTGGGPPEWLLGRYKKGVTGRWHRRWNGARGGEFGTLGGPRRRWTDADAERVSEMRRLHPKWGRGSIAKATGLTEKQVRAILSARG